MHDHLGARPGWQLERARAINRPGQIVGNGMIYGRRRAFLLTPRG